MAIVFCDLTDTTFGRDVPKDIAEGVMLNTEKWVAEIVGRSFAVIYGRNSNEKWRKLLAFSSILCRLLNEKPQIRVELLWDLQ